MVINIFFLIVLLNLFCVVPILILRFESSDSDVWNATRGQIKCVKDIEYEVTVSKDKSDDNLNDKDFQLKLLHLSAIVIGFDSRNGHPELRDNRKNANQLQASKI